MEVIERTDARRGEFDAATGRFARRLASAPGGVAGAYVCGYAKDFNARTFFLPSGATLGGEYEILTQGVQARTVQDAMVRGGVDGALLAVSAYSPPDTSPPSALASLAERGAPQGHAFLGVLEPRPAPGSEQPAALGAALAQELTSSPGTPLPAVVAAMQRRIAQASPGAI